MRRGTKKRWTRSGRTRKRISTRKKKRKKRPPTTRIPKTTQPAQGDDVDSRRGGLETRPSASGTARAKRKTQPERNQVHLLPGGCLCPLLEGACQDLLLGEPGLARGPWRLGRFRLGLRRG